MCGYRHVYVEGRQDAQWYFWLCMPSPSCLSLILFQRLQDLTARDLEKQEREKAANSLEAFIFETQVGSVGGTLALGPVSGEGLTL